MQKNSKDKATVVDNNLCRPQQPYHKSIIHVTRVHILLQLLLLLLLQNFCLALGPPTYDIYLSDDIVCLMIRNMLLSGVLELWV